MDARSRIQVLPKDVTIGRSLDFEFIGCGVVPGFQSVCAVPAFQRDGVAPTVDDFAIGGSQLLVRGGKVRTCIGRSESYGIYSDVGGAGDVNLHGNAHPVSIAVEEYICM